MSWVVNMTGSEEWDCTESFDTKEEAIDHGKELLDIDRRLPEDEREYYDYESFDIGEFTLFEPNVYVYDILEDIQNDAFETCGEAGDEFLYDITEDQENLLQDMMNDTFKKWLKKINVKVDFGSVENVENIIYK